MVTVGEADVLPARSGADAAGSGPSAAAAPDPAAVTVQLSLTDLHGATAPAQPPPPPRRRAERRADEARRRIPWLWIVGGLVALALVGRGVVGAALGPDGGTPSAAPGPADVPAVTASPPVPTGATGADQPVTTVPTVAPAPLPTEARVTLPLAPATTTSPVATSPATSSAPALRCAVSVDRSMFWGGYNATITVRNTGATQVNGWRLTFAIPKAQRITGSWNAQVTARGAAVQAAAAGFNSSLAPGGSTQFGFQARFEGGPERGPGGSGGPSNFALNGVGCA